MDNKLLCPYCGPWNGHPDGVEMVLTKLAKVENGIQVCKVCPECFSESPDVVVDKSVSIEERNMIADSVAEHRFHPMQKPMTLEEIKELRRDPVYLVSLGEDFEDGWQLCLGMDVRGERIVCQMFYTMLFFTHYGKTWIAYRHEPTADVRAAAKWEEG